jgi:hypothetical protein
MVINPIYAQKVLKAYNLQLSMRARTSKGKKNGLAPGDVITISPESKKKSMAAKISQEIVNNLTKNSPRDRMADEVMNQLSRTYGQSLEVEEKTGQGLAFMVASEKKGDPPRYVSREENETLIQKLLDITQTIVYRNLSKGELNENSPGER